MNLETLVILTAGVGAIAVVVIATAYLYYVRIWFRAYTVGTPVSFMRLFALTARRLSAYKLIAAYARAKEEGIAISLDELESEYSAGGDPRQIVQRIMDAHRQGRTMTVQQASERVRQSGNAAMPAVNQEG